MNKKKSQHSKSSSNGYKDDDDDDNEKNVKQNFSDLCRTYTWHKHSAIRIDRPTDRANIVPTHTHTSTPILTTFCYT